MAYELRRARGPQALSPLSRARLLEVHALGAGAAWQDSQVGLHLKGLLLGDSATGSEEPGPESSALGEQALTSLNAARVLAEDNLEQAGQVQEIMRDRFLLLDRLSRPAAAAQLMASLCEQQDTMPGALSSEDLRRGAVLLRAHLTDADATRGPRLASTLMFIVIHTEAWVLTSAPRRLEDLEYWVQDVLAAGDPALLEPPQSFLGQVPALLAVEEYLKDLPPALADHPLAALMETREHHERLERLTRQLAQPTPSDPSSTPDGEADPADEDSGSGDQTPIPPPSDPPTPVDPDPPVSDGGGR